MSGSERAPLTPEQKGLAHQILEEVCELPGGEHAGIVRARCGGDMAVFNEVMSLLGHVDAARTEDFLRKKPELPDMSSTVDYRGENSGESPPTVPGYRIIEQIGEGGMGVVYRAEQTKPVHRRVALKIIKLGMDTKELVARFEMERQALALMDHPNIAKIYDAGSTDQGQPYFAMEYVTGVPITVHCDRHRVSTRERLGIFMQVCQAVQHAHQKGIIHRDLKPSNVLVKVEGDRVIPKIIDFGVAKATNQRLTEHSVYTQLGVMIGTPEYMSPEQAEMTAQDIDTRSDVYSLGVLLYELLVGSLPFDSTKLRQAGLAEIHRIIREVEPPKPSTRLGTSGDDSTVVAQKRRTDARMLARELHGDLDWITMKALEKDRIRRYATASEFAADIARHLNDEPVSAGPPGVTYRFGKFLRKYRGPVIAAAALLLMLVLGLAGTLAMYSRALESEKDATENAQHARQNEEMARQEAGRADRQAALADSRLREVLRLSDIKRLRDYEARAETLWPCVAEKVRDMEAWRTEARELAGRFVAHEKALKRLRDDKSLPYDDAAQREEREGHPKAGALKQLEEFRSKILESMARLKEETSPEAEATLISIGADTGKNPTTYYFRHAFDSEKPQNDTKLTVRMVVDDGALVYLNDTEILRVNMPRGAVTSGMLAAETVDEATEKEHEAPAETLRAGRNLLTAEVHQSSSTSSDLRFDLRLSCGAEELIPPGSTWKYAHERAAVGVGWKEADYDDAAWASGPAPLGYGFKAGRGRLLEFAERLRTLDQEVTILKEAISQRRTWSFARTEEQWLHEVLSELVAGLRDFMDPETGVLPNVERRLDFARTVRQRSIEDRAGAWNRAIASIGSPEECPRYSGLKLVPQLGLIPIGRDQISGLWEFAHLQTGTVPARDREEKVIITRETGLVFVLIPGGALSMGAVKPTAERQEGSPNVDPGAEDGEGPVHDVPLQPFFISKYEMTQGQWLRFTGRNPSMYGPDRVMGGNQHSLLHPVERVSWEDVDRVLGQLELALPTEAQWEYAARAGTGTVWWTGNARESIAGAGNLADSFCKRSGGMSTWKYAEWLDDGYYVHAPVGSYRANGYGLHDTIGNVYEWCRDWYGPYGNEIAGGNGERKVVKTSNRVFRGASWGSPASCSRSAYRYSSTPQAFGSHLGVRPVRTIDR